MAAAGWPSPAQPSPDELRDGWWAGLPYIPQDMRPPGYLGRQLARAGHAALALPANPEACGDDAVVRALSRTGRGCSANRLLGDGACQRRQAEAAAPAEPLVASALGPACSRLAEQAVAAGVARCSAAEEFNTFPALRGVAGAPTPHVLVRFPAADGSPAVRRWAAPARCPAQQWRTAADSRSMRHGGGMFLEVQRLDRHGLPGRSPLVSLATLDACVVRGGSGDWPRLAGRQQALGALDAAALQQVQGLASFGRLSHNADMHSGHLGFRPQAAAGAVAAGSGQRAAGSGQRRTIAPARRSGKCVEAMPMCCKVWRSGCAGGLPQQPQMSLPAAPDRLAINGARAGQLR